eukprot:1194892-Prorocentrum_minimum.AAC.7
MSGCAGVRVRMSGCAGVRVCGSRCPDVRVCGCAGPDVLMCGSGCAGVQVSGCPDVRDRMSRCAGPGVLVSECPDVRVSKCAGVRVRTCTSTPGMFLWPNPGMSARYTSTSPAAPEGCGETIRGQSASSPPGKASVTRTGIGPLPAIALRTALCKASNRAYAYQRARVRGCVCIPL